MEMGPLNPIMLALFLGALALLPMMLIICTSFLKITMVLQLTRNAMGVQQVPPTMALNGIALAATLFIMAPVFSDMTDRLKAIPVDFSSMERLEYTTANGIEPLKTFMRKNTDPDIVIHLQENAQRMWPKRMADSVTPENMLLIIPAFVLSELQNGFKIGFLIFIPFIVVDLIVSNILLALGMQMVSPMTVSLPLKILLFVLISGWTRLLDGLFYSYL
ncbi:MULTISPECIES: type III secretion system export apparatus subunit SctR [Kosakonia]|jgi:type III secretion protein R|uniref:EscR/YscR/HrcR family type III secretion system export apparatus protein n=1 Tax=Kosakonia cowanii JCM 10956 = DSM 18146 TaxID=1300165 RepID=A0A807LG43_9ENTR|nr:MULTISPECIES: type III secretion system export apparatus subunit SctR [Kosakonia]MDP9766799.1 type III secretion protein R [Atlantibacter hermannii]APZ06774.1 EscR/YscR/HrcR family type III secretion system export apparatus protein [Kosakonia cowanii JCM 10956 = DSM 18146]MDF2623090.1 EscR/YscR/HrcR family type secretion system export apparatus protein [Kosakonia cowanii]MDY0889740.1 type III secretion system export apparatus subunit SctR [Kosakonia sp. CFBP8986]TNL11268.1 EscR/YscR/HrcR fa